MLEELWDTVSRGGAVPRVLVVNMTLATSKVLNEATVLFVKVADIGNMFLDASIGEIASLPVSV